MGTEIVEIARQWIGTPYMHQRSEIKFGCDCLGLLRGVWCTYYQSADPEVIPAYTPTWTDHRMDDPLMEAASRYLLRIEKKDLQAGDVVLFRMRRHVAAKHCAILSDQGNMIHAYNKFGVIEAPFTKSWQRKTAAAFRFRDKQ